MNTKTARHPADAILNAAKKADTFVNSGKCFRNPPWEHRVLLLRQVKDVALPIRQMEICREVRSQKDDGQGTEFRSLCSHEERLALVETICAQRSELFIRTSSFVLPYNFPSTDQSFIAGTIIRLYPRTMRVAISIANPQKRLCSLRDVC